MRTTLDLDKKLMDELIEKSGCSTKTEAIETAAREYLRLLQRKRMVSNFGKIQIDPVYKELRKMDREKARRIAKAMSR